MLLHPSSSSHSFCQQRTAYHEAGHAAAIVLAPPGTFWLRGISLRPCNGSGDDDLPERYRHTGAHLTIDPPAKLRALCGPEHRSRAETLLVAVLSGTVAEGMWLRQSPNQGAFRHELAAHALYPLLHVHGGACLPEYRRWLEARAVHLMACHWRGVSRLAAALAEYQDLSGEEARRFLQGRR